MSDETLYKSLFIQARGALHKELLQHLRHPRGMRRSRHHTQKTEDHGRIKDAVSIRERPASVEERTIPGHWEGDLLLGSKHSQIATLVERQTRYVMLVKVNSKDTETVINALTQQAHKLPRELYQSLTWDRGKELADHKRFSLDTHIKVVHPVNGEVPPVKGRPRKLPHYANRGKTVVLEENWQVLAVVFPPFAQRLENSVSRACWPSSMSLGVFHSFHGPCYCSRLY